MKSFFFLCSIFLLFASCSDKKSTSQKKTEQPCTFSANRIFEKHLPLLDPLKSDPQKNEVVFLGDSLTYGPELKRTEPFPQLIDAYWESKAIPFVAVNAGFNGKTTEQTLWRLNDVLTPKTYAVFLEIGANDWNQKRPIKEIRRDYETLIREIQKRKIKLFLAEIVVPSQRPGYNPSYTEAFNSLYNDLAAKHNLPLMPNFLESPHADGLFLSDNIHPNRCGHRLLARDVLAFLNSDWEFVP